MGDLYPPMHFSEKLRATGICALVLVPAITLIWLLVGPKDPYSAVTIVYHHRPWLALPILILFAAVGSGVATVLMAGRLTDFGVFAIGVALAGLSFCGGNLSALLRYQAENANLRGAVHGHLALDVLLWTLVAAAGYLACALVEARLYPLSTDALSTKGKGGSPAASDVWGRWLSRHARLTGTPSDWATELRQGALAAVICLAVAIVVIRLAAGRPDGPVKAGQVCFAVGLGFWLGAIAANQFCRPALGVWCCLVVPLVALVGHCGVWLNPSLPEALRQYTDIVTMAPNGLARGLPIDYLSIGPAAAVLGVWTSRRIHRARSEAAEE